MTVNVRHSHWPPAEEMSDLAVLKEDDHRTFFKLEFELVSGCLIQGAPPPAVKSQAVQRVLQADGGHPQCRVHAED